MAPEPQLTDPHGRAAEASAPRLSWWFLRGPVAIFLCVALVIGVAGISYLRHQIASSHAAAEKELLAIADFKAREIANWYEERLQDARFFRQTSWVSDVVAAFLADSSATEPRDRVRTFLTAIWKELHYSRVLLLDSGEELRFAVPEDSDGVDPSAQSYVAEALRNGQVLVSDLHASKIVPGAVEMDIFVPLLPPTDSAEPGLPPVGVLMLELRPQEFLFPAIQAWPTPSRTAETLLVRREGDEVVYLNELRHRANTALTLRFPINSETKLPAGRAVSGYEGVLEGVDYRNVPVLAATRVIPGTPWFIVAKVDCEEVYAPLRERAWTTGVLLVVLLLAGALGAGWLERRRAAHWLRTQLDHERERQALAERIVHLTKHANDIILLMDQDGKILEANDCALRAYGRSLEELQRLNLRDLCVSVSEAKTDQPAPRMELREGVMQTAMHRRHDGSTFPVECSIGAVELGGVRYHHAIIRDVTERQRAEETQAHLEAQLRQAQKMEAVGQLAGGVAHDFNNILTAILGNCDLALEQLRGQGLADHPVAGDVQQIERSAVRAATLTRQLLTFSRRQVTRPEAVDLHETVTELETMLRRLITENIDLQVASAANLPCIRVDRAQMEQVIMNLVVNARDAMPHGGTLTIETASVTLDADYASRHTEPTPGPYVLLAISDTGCGMDAATRERIFEPFFTTKPAGVGTGLGLATVYGIVKQAGGHIVVYSEPGQGSTFRIYLPVTETPVAPSRAAPEQERPVEGTETVLVCEDDEAVRLLTVRILESAGYRVLGAANGAEALRMAAQQDKGIDLLITDVIMPDMNGVKLANTLSAQMPQLAWLFVSGYSGNVITHHGVLDPGVAFLEKPFSRRGLLRRVRELLDRPPRGARES